ncbi:adenine-specific DNA-methyltransferase [Arsukibacterium tuosuense]|uniref:Adenine-specific DNA-methyltransferase n=1 Tax=Arsukibacterium tuosuense TaxID=1323745 RepID=A0A285JEF1_9GAMM|nr:DNA methyltransferase [Arsukibacterium tuosuense]SNY58453.1 adenine-specific DNA-methyltransferase [Arsukibacterium tuosuense]
MSKYNELVKKLKEIFQIDKPELDFGIYRILNMRAKEINDYLDNKLKAKIQAALADAGNANKTNIEQQLQAAIKAATDAGFEPEQSPKVQELKKQLAATASGVSEHENAVYSHLLTFFSRYYDNGDFISQRRYKGDTYAIPYAGEEVMLHWANKDQYYIKSGENFANYSFKLTDGRKVSFKLLTADTAKDNRKDNEADRRFVLIEPHVRTKIDEDGEEYEQPYNPVEVVKNRIIQDGQEIEREELIIHFEYKTVNKGTKQDGLVQDAISKILAAPQVQHHWADLANRAPTETKPNRTELERHLTTYTQRNSADYFIHKDLGGFLTNELDFYIKNEVMNLDNLQNAQVFASVEKQLRMIQCLRNVAQELVIFLSQLENVQKNIWLKRKFVVSCDYCVTLDLLPEELFDEICANKKQWDQWRSQRVVEQTQLANIGFLKQNLALMIDTTLYSREFKEKLLRSIDNLDELINGVLIGSENYQAAKLMTAKYKGKADLVYLDPPYNTDATPILYKNGYKESSWASLMGDRILASKYLLTDDGVISYAIDDTEASLLKELEKQVNPEREVFQCIVEHYPGSGTGRSNVSRTHEYCIFSVPNGADILRGDAVEDGIRTRGFRRAGTGDNNFRIGNPGRPESFFAVLVNKNTFKVEGVEPPPPPIEKGNYPLEDTVEGFKRVYPLGKNGEERVWSLSYEGAKRAVVDGRLISSKDFVINRLYHDKARRLLLPSIWQGTQYNATTGGTNLLTNLFGDSGRFSYPKSLGTMSRVLDSVFHSKETSLTFDLFGGSGTTAHAVINRNRAFDENHKYVLVEMGQHADSVIKERICKAAFSDQWVDGRPINNSNGISHCLKVIKLESYEDALNNINDNQNHKLEDLFGNNAVENEYFVKYSFSEQINKSKINTEHFSKPFDCMLDIAVDSAGSREPKCVDLVETFNYLIGLHVKSIESNLDRGYVRIEGTLPTGELTLVFWRDCDKIGYEELAKYANRFDLYAKEQTFDVIYINGDHNLPTAFTLDTEQGEVTRSLKLRQIEPEFLSLMFAEEA